MSLREIRYRLRHDFQLAVLSSMALVALSIITPFTIYRLLKADWMMTIVDSVLILAIIATVLYAWYTGNARRSCQALMYFDFVPVSYTHLDVYKRQGVLRTRALPNSCKKPSVILNAPPYSAISCPINIRLLCLCILWYNPSRMPSINRASLLLDSLSKDG